MVEILVSNIKYTTVYKYLAIELQGQQNFNIFLIRDINIQLQDFFYNLAWTLAFTMGLILCISWYS